MSPAFRAGLPEDVEAVVALVESAYRGEASRAGWTTEADLLAGQRTDALAIGSLVTTGGLLVATGPDGAVIGCCQLERRDGGAYFGTFAVRPTGQGAGVGGALLAEAERRAVAAGAGWLELTVLVQRTELIAWYERRGYVATGEQRPFPYGDSRFGLPLRNDLAFRVFRKPLPGAAGPVS